jgi:hypothetical protein
MKVSAKVRLPTSPSSFMGRDSTTLCLETRKPNHAGFQELGYKKKNQTPRSAGRSAEKLSRPGPKEKQIVKAGWRSFETTLPGSPVGKFRPDCHRRSDRACSMWQGTLSCMKPIGLSNSPSKRRKLNPRLEPSVLERTPLPSEPKKAHRSIQISSCPPRI